MKVSHCAKCEGEGKIKKYRFPDHINYTCTTQIIDCPFCDGTGHIVEEDND